MRSAESTENVLARAGTGVDEAAIPQFFQSATVSIQTFTLIVRAERSAAIRPFLPLESKPAQVLNHRRDKFLLAAGAIEVFVAQDQNAAMPLRALLSDPKGTRMAEVQIARRRRREPASVAWTATPGTRNQRRFKRAHPGSSPTIHSVQAIETKAVFGFSRS